MLNKSCGNIAGYRDPDIAPSRCYIVMGSIAVSPPHLHYLLHLTLISHLTWPHIVVGQIFNLETKEKLKKVIISRDVTIHRTIDISQ